MRTAALTITLAAVATACLPAEIAMYNSLDPAGKARITEHLKQVHDNPVLACIRRHESDTNGSYQAENPTSTASGAYQYIDATWRTMSTRAGHPGTSHASEAQWWVQDAVALYTVLTVGTGPWAGSGC
jgi:hypothetical protein